MMSGHGLKPFYFSKKNWVLPRTLANPHRPTPTFGNISFLLYTPPLPPQSGCHMCIIPIYITGMGGENFCRNKMSGIPVKNHGKEQTGCKDETKIWEQLVNICCIIMVMMHGEYPLVGERTLPSSLQKN